jgi:hypothetical protein
MNLKDEIAEAQSVHAAGGRKSRIVEIMEKMEPQDAADLRAALDDHTVSASVIERVMAKRGFKLSVNMVYKYRKGDYVTV